MTTNLQLDNPLTANSQAVTDQNGNRSSLNISSDRLGIGTADPKAKLHVSADIVAGTDANGYRYIFHTRTHAGGDFLHITGDDANGNWQWDRGISLVKATGNMGIGTTHASQRLTLGSGNVQLPAPVAGEHGNLYFGGITDQGQIGMRLFGGYINNTYQSGFIDVRAGNLENGLVFRVDDVQGGMERMRINANGNVGIGTQTPEEALHVAGNIAVDGDIRLLNADCAEDFDICDADIEAGTVMVLGDDGSLHPSSQAYDKRVAGVVSGAGQYQPGIVLDKQPTGKPRKPIALMGKVYCKVDAAFGAIDAGDLLTTSPTPGHAMKAGDAARAFGTVIGKALRPFADGQGLVPVLVALQ
ncbi:hypothetical protein ACH518_06845 [Methylomonas sp. HW2-6]|uniref:hypothetical protein n=1 Tax=Methylomonas sp. HW2-6 TaxID=3376687 RepID=UPI00404249D6